MSKINTIRRNVIQIIQIENFHNLVIHSEYIVVKYPDIGFYMANDDPYYNPSILKFISQTHETVIFFDDARKKEIEFLKEELHRDGKINIWYVDLPIGISELVKSFVHNKGKGGINRKSNRKIKKIKWKTKTKRNNNPR
jgi:hypothetical protein